MKWIKLEDELPPDGVPVICYYPNYIARKGTQWEHQGYGGVEVYSYEPRLYDRPVWLHAYHEYPICKDHEPTHWMHFPEDPK